jgi:6-phosphogluconolactonase (cycloisomerase 2 family)
MFQVFGFKRSFVLGWLFASCLVLFLIISGCVISPRRTLGGGGATPTPNPTGTPTPTPSTTPQGKLYVSNAATNSIVRFDQALTDSGNIVPGATISGTNTTLNAPAFITLDVAADRLYVANNADISILIFDNISTKTGNVAPERSISGSNTTLNMPLEVSVDQGRDLLYVADDVNIHVFASASTATGNIAPARNLSPGFSVSAVLIDGANDRLYAVSQAGNAITVYDSASTLASGSITASRTIQGLATHLSGPDAIQLDGAGRLVVSNATAPSITIYNNAATANGNVAPAAEITGTNTNFGVPRQIALDNTGSGTLYNADSVANRVAVYSSLSTATGNIAPNRAFAGPGTTLTGGQPTGVAIDRTR